MNIAANDIKMVVIYIYIYFPFFPFQYSVFSFYKYNMTRNLLSPIHLILNHPAKTPTNLFILLERFKLFSFIVQSN